MGLYYKTDKSKYINPVVSLPEQTLLATVMQADKHTDEVYQQIASYKEELSKLQALPYANKEINDRMQQLMNEIDGYTQALSKNPAARGFISGKIRQAGINLAKDLYSGRLGELVKAQQQYSEYKKGVDELTQKHPEQYKKEDARLTTDYNYLQSELNYYITGGEGKGLSQWKTYIDVPQYSDPTKRIFTMMKQPNSNVISAAGKKFVYDEKGNKWLEKRVDKYEVVSADKVAGAVSNALYTDQEFKDYYYKKGYMSAYNSRVYELLGGRDIEEMSKTEEGRNELRKIQQEADEYAKKKAEEYVTKAAKATTMSAIYEWTGKKHTIQSYDFREDKFDLQRSAYKYKKLENGELISQGGLEYNPLPKELFKIDRIFGDMNKYNLLFSEKGVNALASKTGLDVGILSNYYTNGKFDYQKFMQDYQSGKFRDNPKARDAFNYITDQYEEYLRTKRVYNTAIGKTYQKLLSDGEISKYGADFYRDYIENPEKERREKVIDENGNAYYLVGKNKDFAGGNKANIKIVDENGNVIGTADHLDAALSKSTPSPSGHGYVFVPTKASKRANFILKVYGNAKKHGDEVFSGQLNDMQNTYKEFYPTVFVGSVWEKNPNFRANVAAEFKAMDQSTVAIANPNDALYDKSGKGQEKAINLFFQLVDSTDPSEAGKFYTVSSFTEKEIGGTVYTLYEIKLNEANIRQDPRFKKYWYRKIIKDKDGKFYLKVPGRRNGRGMGSSGQRLSKYILSQKDQFMFGDEETLQRLNTIASGNDGIYNIDKELDYITTPDFNQEYSGGSNLPSGAEYGSFNNNPYVMITDNGNWGGGFYYRDEHTGNYKYHFIITDMSGNKIKEFDVPATYDENIGHAVITPNGRNTIGNEIKNFRLLSSLRDIQNADDYKEAIAEYKRRVSG